MHRFTKIFATNLFFFMNTKKIKIKIICQFFYETTILPLFLGGFLAFIAMKLFIVIPACKFFICFSLILL